MNNKILIIVGIIVLVLGFLSTRFLWNENQNNSQDTPIPAVTSVPTEFTLTSPAFENFGTIPSKYSCDGENISLPFDIYNVPENTVSLTLIMEDLDSPRGNFTHWLLWNIEPDTGEITENQTPAGAGVGVNDFSEIRYGGPCPPDGEHRYLITLYALDKYLTFSEKTNRSQVLDAINGHVISKTQLTGLYSR